jgi:hypothetical protein
MAALNNLACSRRLAHSQVTADAELLKTNNAVAVNAKLQISVAILSHQSSSLKPSWR